MTTLLVGTTGFPGRRERFPAADLHAVDLPETADQRLKPRTLARWRAQTPETVRFVARARTDVTHPSPGKPGSGHFRDSDVVRGAWAETVEAARALEAAALLLRTPPSFTPTTGHRATLGAFVSGAAEDLPGVSLIWEPRGVWEDEEVAEWASEAGLIPSVDPQRTIPPPGEEAFFRLGGSGGVRSRYDDLELLDVLARAAEHQRCWVLFDHLDMLRDALRLALLAKEADGR